MHLTLTYSDIINAIKSHYATCEGLDITDIKLDVIWEHQYDCKPIQEDFSATANFKIK